MSLKKKDNSEIIQVKSPFRISLFGGGSDFPEWFNKFENGATINASINKYCNITFKYLPNFFKNKYRIVWSKIELVDKIDKIKHPLIREGLKLYCEKAGLEIHHFGDLPARSGIGSSSAFSVAFIKGLKFLQKKSYSKKKIIDDAIFLERKILKESGGWQDQIISCFGGLRYTKFFSNNNYKSNLINISQTSLNNLQNSLFLFYLGNERNAFAVQNELINNFKKKKRDLKDIIDITNEAKNIILSQKNYKELGNLLKESWKIKGTLTKHTTNNKVDEIYEFALKNGAIGGKLLGAGKSGFLLFFVENKNKLNFLRKFKNRIIHIPFKFENKGVHIK